MANIESAPFVTKTHPRLVKLLQSWTTKSPEAIQAILDAYRKHKHSGSTDWEGNGKMLLQVVRICYRSRRPGNSNKSFFQPISTQQEHA